MKKLLIIAFGLALGACAAQQSAVNAPDAPRSTAESAAAGRQAANNEEGSGAPEAYRPSAIERRDMTGSRINRVRRRSEPAEDTTAGKRVETIGREELDDLEERGLDNMSGVLPPGE